MTTKTTEKEESKQSIYTKLSQIDVKPYLSKKMGLNYLSWAKAWGLVKAIYPNSQKEITKYPEYLPINGEWKSTGRTVDYCLTPFGCEVEVTVEIEGNKYSSNLYVMNHRNQAVRNLKELDMGQINKTQQRCLVKALAYAGLGLDVYAGEDLPSDESTTATKPKPRKVESLTQRITKAKKFEVQYGGGKEKLVDVCKWEEQGDQQAKAFLDNWRTKSKGNEAAYNFIKDQGLQKESA